MDRRSVQRPELPTHPAGATIAFDATRNPDLIHLGTSDVYVLNMGDDAVKRIVTQPGPDANPHWSPDGKQIVFESVLGNPAFFHCNRRLAVVQAPPLLADRIFSSDRVDS